MGRDHELALGGNRVPSRREANDGCADRRTGVALDHAPPSLSHEMGRQPYRPDAVLDVARRAFGLKQHNAYVLYHPRQTLVDHRDESPLAARAPTVVMPAPPIKRRLVTRTAG